MEKPKLTGGEEQILKLRYGINCAPHETPEIAHILKTHWVRVEDRERAAVRKLVQAYFEKEEGD